MNELEHYGVYDSYIDIDIFITYVYVVGIFYYNVTIFKHITLPTFLRCIGFERRKQESFNITNPLEL